MCSRTNFSCVLTTNVKPDRHCYEASTWLFFSRIIDIRHGQRPKPQSRRWSWWKQRPLFVSCTTTNHTSTPAIVIHHPAVEELLWPMQQQHSTLHNACESGRALNNAHLFTSSECGDRRSSIEYQSVSLLIVIPPVSMIELWCSRCFVSRRSQIKPRGRGSHVCCRSGDDLQPCKTTQVCLLSQTLCRLRYPHLSLFLSLNLILSTSLTHVN